MISLPDSGWVLALLDQRPAGAFVVAIGLFGIACLGPVPNWAFVLLLLTALVCLAPPANWLVSQIEAWRRARREIRQRPQVLAHLRDLGPWERKILADCLRNNEPSFTCFLGDSTATSLRQKGLATALPGWPGNLRWHPHIIPDYVWDELRGSSQEILTADDARERAEAQRKAAARGGDGWLKRL